MFGGPNNPSGSETIRNECVILLEQIFADILNATINNVSENSISTSTNKTVSIKNDAHFF